MPSTAAPPNKDLRDALEFPLHPRPTKRATSPALALGGVPNPDLPRLHPEQRRAEVPSEGVFQAAIRAGEGLFGEPDGQPVQGQRPDQRRTVAALQPEQRLQPVKLPNRGPLLPQV